MIHYWCILTLLASGIRIEKAGAVAREKATYNAVVVEYSPVIDDTVESAKNFLNNVFNYVEIIKSINNDVDIIVFPEASLIGYSNQEYYLELPDPEEHYVLCAKQTRFQTPLVMLSCAARAAAIYLVVNLSEKTFDFTEQKVMNYNTDVVFNRQGAIIARYRKIHLFGEQDKQPPVEKEIVYFDTDFGVRFGIFTCFDIIFKDPGIVSGMKYNISHFIFPTAWFSEMPFLTAIQEQWYWSYTQDAVLLASGYNMPSSGSSGTGIYLGHRGPAIYKMSQTRQSFLLHAEVPKNIHSTGSTRLMASIKELKTSLSNYVGKGNDESSASILKLNRDYLDVYATLPISIPEDTKEFFNGTDLIVKFEVSENLCHNKLCCEFSLKVTLVYNLVKKPISRGDDYSQMNFRMAAFDGVRTYDHFATGGLQTCAIIPCIRGDLLSCGLRSDNPSAETNSILGYHQTSFSFDYVQIKGTFSNNDSFIGPNVLLGGEDNNFGSLLEPEGFTFSTINETKSSVVKSLETTRPINNLVTLSLYGRLFDRDGQTYTGSPNRSSSSRYHIWSFTLLLFTLFIVKCNY